MQGITEKILFFALAVGVTGCVNSGHTGKVEQGVVEVIRLKGMARYSVDDKSWHRNGDRHKVQGRRVDSNCAQVIRGFLYW